MAVLKWKRGVAWSEFERNMAQIHRDLEARMHALPQRYKKLVCRRLYEPMNAAYSALIMANEQKGHGKDAEAKREKAFRYAMERLMEMEKPLMAFLNVRGAKEKTCEALGNAINHEIALIGGAAGWKEEMPVFRSLNRKKFEKLAFLGKMGELHRYTLNKASHAPGDCYDALSVRLSDYATRALYDVVVANDKMPQTRAEAEARDALLKDAIDSLNAMQRPMVGLWNITQYSERVMEEWSGMLSEEINILSGLRQKDRERFRGLR